MSNYKHTARDVFSIVKKNGKKNEEEDSDDNEKVVPTALPAVVPGVELPAWLRSYMAAGAGSSAVRASL